jgi:serine/threonine protein phosphatase PrpC
VVDQVDRMEVPQDRDTLQSGRRGPFRWRYTYVRSADSRANDDIGQDYLTFRVGERAFTFALCDGVSQSFYGDLAARLLGEALVNWFSNDLPVTLETSSIRQALTTCLAGLTPRASTLVARQPLPPAIPPLFRDVLEQKRSLGSQSMFVCGGVELSRPRFPTGRIVLAWMGDSRLRFWGQPGSRETELGGAFTSAERWSTARGPVGGEPHVFAAALDPRAVGGFRLLAYSDGLSALDSHDDSPPDEAVRALLGGDDAAALSDDATFFEIYWSHQE